MNLDMSVHKRIADARKAAGLSQHGLAAEISASQSTVATWERGKNEPDLKTFKRIAKAVNSLPEWLAFGVNETGVSLAIVPELDLRASSGPGGLIEVTDDSSEMVVRKYGFPKEEFRTLFGAKPDGIVILEVVGDSMVPTLVPGERVIINTKDRSASPPGIFVVWDGLGLVLKRVEYVAHSEPPRVRIMSDNPRYDAYERNLDDAAIQGRVIGSLQRR